MSAAASPWDANPLNAGGCTVHGPHAGLICTACVVTLPAWTAAPPPRDPHGTAVRTYARVLGVEPGAVDPGGPR